MHGLCEAICADADSNRNREVGIGLETLEDLVVTMMTTEAMG